MSAKRASPAIVWEGVEPPRIPPGEYTARCTGFQGPEWVIAYGRWGLRMEFTLDPDDVKVSEFYSFGENRSKPHVGSRSKYHKDWVRANNGLPKHGQEMTPDVFLNPDLCFTVLVGDCKTDGENAEKHPALVYSIVTKIIEVKRPSTEEDMQVCW